VAYKAGQAFIDVVPSLRGFNKQISRELRENSQKVEIPVQPTVDGRVLDRDFDRAGVSAGGKFSDAFRKRLDAAYKALPDIPISADITGVNAALAGLRARLDAMRDLRIGVDIDAGEAQAELAALVAELQAVARDDASVDVRVNAGQAIAELSAVQAMINRLDGEDAEVDVHVNDSQAIGSTRFLATQIGGLILLGGAIAPAFLPGLGAVTVAVGGLAAAFAGAGVGVGGLIAVALPAISAVTEAVKAQETAEKSAATTSGTRAAQQLSNAYAAQQAAQRVADAQRDVARTAEDGDRRIASAQERVIDSGIALLNAQEDQRRAQEDLTRARQDALRTLEDMRELVSDLARDEQSAEIALEEAKNRLTGLAGGNDTQAEAAQIALADARARLAEVNKNSASSELDRRRALLDVAQAEERLQQVQRDSLQLGLDRRKAALDVEEAEDRLSDVKRDQGRATDELNEAERRGIDGMEQVVNAQDSLEDATLSVTKALRGNRDAELELARARQDAAQANEDASRRVTDALAAQAQQAELAAMQMESGNAAIQNLAYAMDQLTPEQRKLMDGFLHLRDAFLAWATSLEPAVLPLFIRGMQIIEKLLPMLTPIVLAVAGAFAGLLDSAEAALGSPFWQDFFGFLAATAGPSATAFGQALGNIATGFAGLLMAFGPVSGDIMNGLVDLTEAFADWGTSLDQNQGFQNFLAYVQQNWPKVKEMLAAFVRAIGNIIQSMAPLGGPLLGVLTGIFTVIATIDPIILASIVSGLIGIAAGIKVWTIAQAILNNTMKANVLLLVISLILGLASALVSAYETSETFRNVVDAVFNAVWGAIKFVFNWVKDNWPLILAILIGPVGLAALAIIRNWDSIVAGLKRAWAAIKTNVIDPLVAGFWGIVHAAQGLYDGVVGIFQGIGDFLGGIFSGALTKVKQGINWVIGVINDFFIGGLNIVLDVIPGIPSIEPIDPIKMHSGGIVPGTGETPRMLLGGEAVLNPKATQTLGPAVVNALNNGEGFGGPFDGWSWDTVKVGLGLGLSRGQNPDLINDAAKLLEKGLAFVIQNTLEPAKNKVLDVLPEKPLIPGGAARSTIDHAYNSLFGWAKDKDTERPPTIIDFGFSGRGKDGFTFPLLPGSYRVGVPINGYPGHTGQDFPTPTGNAVLAPMAGVVNFINKGNRSYGKYASIQGAGGVRSIQAHLSAFAGKTGRVVSPGELVGLSGSTGNSTGPHLHQEFRVNGSVVDPRRFLTFDSGGYLMPGLTMAYNGTGVPERILDPSDTRSYDGGNSVTVQAYGTPASLTHEVAFMLETRRQARRPVMRG